VVGAGGDVGQGVVSIVRHSIVGVVGRAVSRNVGRGVGRAMIGGAVSDCGKSCRCCGWGHRE